MEDLIKAYELLMNVAPITNDMALEGFGSFYCMLLEEWCKAQRQDINTVLAQLVMIILAVNEEEGRY